jgi:hypothetical protein
MSTTIRLAAGDYYVDSRGRFYYTESDREKCAQDVACTLLQDVYPDGRWGNQLNVRQSNSSIGARGIHKPVIQSDVSDSINRLIALQQQDRALGAAEEIDKFTITVSSQPQDLHYAYVVEVQRKNKDQDDPLKIGYLVDLSQVQEK